MNLHVKPCDEPVKVGIALKVLALNIDWHHDLDASTSILIPQFEIPGLGGVGIEFEAEKLDNGDLKLKVSSRCSRLCDEWSKGRKG